jgi:hypothetical protein
MTASENKEQWRKKNGIKDLKEDKVAFTLWHDVGYSMEVEFKKISLGYWGICRYQTPNQAECFGIFNYPLKALKGDTFLRT